MAAGLAGWQSARDPLVWNWTESEHRDGRTRWACSRAARWFARRGLGLVLRRRAADPQLAVQFLLPRPGPAARSASGSGARSISGRGAR